jgi:hypothetical protein
LAVAVLAAVNSLLSSMKREEALYYREAGLQKARLLSNHSH